MQLGAEQRRHLDCHFFLFFFFYFFGVLAVTWEEKKWTSASISSGTSPSHQSMLHFCFFKRKKSSKVDRWTSSCSCAATEPLLPYRLCTQRVPLTHWLHMFIFSLPEHMTQSFSPLKKLSRVIKPLFLHFHGWCTDFSKKIIAYNLSFCSPLPCKYGGEGNFHLALMYQFNITIRVSNLSPMPMQRNWSHGCWVLWSRCQLLDRLQVLKVLLDKSQLRGWIAVWASAAR